MSAPRSVAAGSGIDYSRKATLAFTAPYAVFVAVMAVEHLAGLSPQIFYPIRLFLAASALLIFSRPYLQFRPAFPISSIFIGLAVFVLWVAPDRLFDYRHFVLFENPLTGTAASSIPPELRKNLAFIAARTIGCTVAVPILEELFWRGWLMRWLANQDFLKVPLGAYVRSSFWLVAILFASEHGPYWEVGLLAGIIYNWWIIRTRNLADCIIAHAVTNGCLSVYVLATGLWRYWL